MSIGRQAGMNDQTPRRNKSRAQTGAKNRPMKRAGLLADLSCRSDGLTRLFLFTKWKIG